MISKKWAVGVLLFILTNTGWVKNSNAVNATADIQEGVSSDQAQSERLEKSVKRVILEALSAVLIKKIHVPASRLEVGSPRDGVEIPIKHLGENYRMLRYFSSQNSNYHILNQDGVRVGADVIIWGRANDNNGLSRDEVEIRTHVYSFTVQHQPSSRAFRSESVFNKEPVSISGEFQDAYQSSYEFLDHTQSVYVFHTTDRFRVVDVKTGKELDVIPIQKNTWVIDLVFTKLFNGSEIALYEDTEGDLMLVNRVTDPLLSTPLYLEHRVFTTYETKTRYSEDRMIEIDF